MGVRDLYRVDGPLADLTHYFPAVYIWWLMPPAVCIYYSCMCISLPSHSMYVNTRTHSLPFPQWSPSPPHSPRRRRSNLQGTSVNDHATQRLADPAEEKLQSASTSNCINWEEIKTFLCT